MGRGAALSEAMAWVMPPADARRVTIEWLSAPSAFLIAPWHATKGLARAARAAARPAGLGPAQACQRPNTGWRSRGRREATQHLLSADLQAWRVVSAATTVGGAFQSERDIRQWRPRTRQSRKTKSKANSWLASERDYIPLHGSTLRQVKRPDQAL